MVDEAQYNPNFYEAVDRVTGLNTRRLIATPLRAKERFIGVMEVINKSGGDLFSDEDRLLLDSIAEEIAFAIRNGKMFEVVVKSYCKQRQGLNTCKGCKRPLGSWTPCVKYREASIEV